MKKILLFLLFLLAHLAYPQVGNWTWMKGDTITYQFANYGTIGISSPTNKPGATYEGTEWKDLSGNFWLYDKNDLWKFNPITLDWTWVKGTQGIQSYGVYGTKGVSSPLNHPGYRILCSASWVDNAGNLWLFGGTGYNGDKNDLWKYNVLSNQWTWMKGDSAGNKIPQFGAKGNSNINNNPGCLLETSATWVDSSNNLWLFGGLGLFSTSSPSAYWNTLWKYNVTINEWTWVSGDNFPNASAVYGVKGVSSSSNKPSARFAYSRWVKNDTLWLFGGMNSGMHNDLWRYAISSNEWTWVSGSDTANNKGIYGLKCKASSSIYPCSRSESRSCWKDFNGNFWLFGGFDFNACFNDLWVYSSNANKWTWVYGDSISSNPTKPNYGAFQVPNLSNNPGGRGGSVSWIDGYGKLWVFGGTNFAGSLNDLWKYNVDSTCNGFFTKINEFNYVQKFQIAPVPFNESFTIQFSLKKNSRVFIYLRNMEGQILKTFNDYSSSLDYKILCDFKELSLIDGLYVIDIKIDEQIVSRKVIKLGN